MQDVKIIEFLPTDDEGQSQESEEDQADARLMILCYLKIDIFWNGLLLREMSSYIYILTEADFSFK